MPHRFLFLLVALVALSPHVSTAQMDQLPWPPVLPGQTPDLRSQWGTLPNGLRYATIKTERQENEVSLRLLVNSGTFHETKNQYGAAHFVERMAFKNNRSHTSAALLDFFSESGMSIDHHAVAHTGPDSTVYSLNLKASNDSRLAQALTFYSDILDGLSFLEDDIEHERKAIAQEANLKHIETKVTQDEESSLHWKRLPRRIADADPDAAIRDAKDLKTKDLKEYWETHYAPENAIIVMAGDLDHERARELIAEQLGNIERNNAQSPRKEFAKTASGESEAIDHSANYIEATAYCVSEETDFFSQESFDDFARLKIISDHLKDQLYINKLSEANTLHREWNQTIWSQKTFGNTQNWQTNIAVIDRKIQNIKAFGIPEAHLKIIKKKRLAEVLSDPRSTQSESPEYLCDLLLRSISKRFPYLIGEAYQSWMQSIIPSLTTSGTRQLANAFFENKNIYFVLKAPKAAKINRKRIDSFIKKARKLTTPTKTKSHVLPKEYTEAPSTRSPSRVLKHFTSEFNGREAYHYQLSNNTRINMLPTNLQPGSFTVHLRFGHGLNDRLPFIPASKMTGDLLFDFISIDDEETEEDDKEKRSLERVLSDHGLTHPRTTATHTSYNIQANGSSTEDLEIFLIIASKWLTDGEVKEDYFKYFEEAIKAKSRRDEDTLAALETNAALFTDEAYIRDFPLPSDLDAFTFERIAESFNQALAKGQCEITLSGDFTRSSALSLTRHFLGQFWTRKPGEMPTIEPDTQNPLPPHQDLSPSPSPGVSYLGFQWQMEHSPNGDELYHIRVIERLVQRHLFEFLSGRANPVYSYNLTTQGIETIADSLSLNLFIYNGYDDSLALKEEIVNFASQLSSKITQAQLDGSKGYILQSLASEQNNESLSYILSNIQTEPENIWNDADIRAILNKGDLQFYQNLMQALLTPANTRSALKTAP